MNKLLLGLTVVLSVASIYIYQAETNFQEAVETDGELLSYSNYCSNYYINSDILYQSMEYQVNTTYNRLSECNIIDEPTIGIFRANNLYNVITYTNSQKYLKSSDTYKIFSLAQSNPSRSLHTEFFNTVRNLSYSCWSSNSSQLDSYITYLRDKYPNNYVSYVEQKNTYGYHVRSNSNVIIADRKVYCANNYTFEFILH